MTRLLAGRHDESGLTDESGFTMVELIITMAVMSVFIAMAGVSLINMSKAARTTDNRSTVNDAARQALEAVSRNVRAANPIDAQDPVTLYATGMSFEVYCSSPGVGSCPATSLRKLDYRVANNVLSVSTNGGAYQQILGPIAQTAIPGFTVAQRQYAIVNSATEPVFTFFKRDGSTPISSQQFHDCTKYVTIRLKVITETGNTKTPADLSTTVTLRNYNEVSNCII
jgi:prepilin-type N-terminal cleavage/methylation domain-containing protein